MAKKPAAPSPETVKGFRAYYDITQQAAAELAGVDIRSWQRYEAGDRIMPPLRWIALKRVSALLAEKRKAAISHRLRVSKQKVKRQQSNARGSKLEVISRQLLDQYASSQRLGPLSELGTQPAHAGLETWDHQ